METTTSSRNQPACPPQHQQVEQHQKQQEHWYQPQHQQYSKAKQPTIGTTFLSPSSLSLKNAFSCGSYNWAPHQPTTIADQPYYHNTNPSIIDSFSPSCARRQGVVVSPTSGEVSSSSSTCGGIGSVGVIGVSFGGIGSGEGSSGGLLGSPRLFVRNTSSSSTTSTSSFASSFIDHHHNSCEIHKQQSLSPSSSVVGHLLDRLDDYESRGWLSQEEYYRYRQRLLQNLSSENCAKEVNLELDQLATTMRRNNNKNHQNNRSISAASEATGTTSSSIAGSQLSSSAGQQQQLTSILLRNTSRGSRGRHVSWEDQSRASDAASACETTTSSATEENTPPGATTGKVTAAAAARAAIRASGVVGDKENSSQVANPPNSSASVAASLSSSSSGLILEPVDLWKGSLQFTEQQLQQIFVEMCFFARLGFVQPPCCLHCTYNESKVSKKSMTTANNNNTSSAATTTKNNDCKMCTRWVVWRKNAQTLLHPNRLDGNIMIVQCHVARSLLAGKVVEGRRWDPVQKRVVVQSSQSG